MSRDEIFALIERMTRACPPECSVEFVPTKHQGKVYLIIIQFPAEEIALEEGFSTINQHSADFQKILERNPSLKTVYLWEEQKIHKFHYENILPLLKDNAEHFRVVYCCGSKFVLYVHSVLSLEHYFNVIDYIGMNDDKHYKYIGNCRNIDILIGYLMRTFEPF